VPPAGVMIVRQFLQWVRAAKAGERAEATFALAGAYLYSDLSAEDLAAAEAAMIVLLDDPSPLVRRAMADAFASSQEAPKVVVLALAADQIDVSLPLLQRSPLLEEDHLIHLIRTGNTHAQTAIAGRASLSTHVAAAIAEFGSAEACFALLENCDAEIPLFWVDRIVDRFGEVAQIRENLLARDDLPISMRQALLSKFARTLAGFVAERQWLGNEHADSVARDACEKATVALAADTPYEDIGGLVRHLRVSGQLTAGMLLRALLSGNIVLLESALAELASLPLEHVARHLQDRTFAGFRAIYRKAELPELAYPAFRATVEALRHLALVDEIGEAAQLKRHLVEHVLQLCIENRCDPKLLALLRRFLVEAGREEARLFTGKLVAEPATSELRGLHSDVRLAA
jgi:uncharacterized protein (DUF2336 family)